MFLRRHRSLCSHPFCDAQGPSYSSNKSDGVAVVTYRFRGTLLPWLARFTAVANPRSLQQIDKIADGRYRRAAEAQQRRREQQAAAQKAAMTGRAAAAAAEAQRKPLGAGDVCPICQDDMTKDEVLTFCPACGNNIHTDCMKMWSEHRQGTGEVVTCPLCREAWGPRCVVVLAQACIIFARGHLTYFVAGVYSALRGMVEQKKEEKRRPVNVHPAAECKSCKTTPIYGMRYRCVFCVNTDLCARCFNRGKHSRHTFVCRQRSAEPWTPAMRQGEGPRMPPELADLQVGLARVVQETCS